MSVVETLILLIFALIVGGVLGALLLSALEIEGEARLFGAVICGVLVSSIVFVGITSDVGQKFLNGSAYKNTAPDKHKVQKEEKKQDETKKDTEIEKKKENTLLKSKWMTSYDDKKFTTEELFSLKKVQEDAITSVYDKALILEDNPSNKNLNNFRDELFKTYDKLSESKYVY